MKRPISYSGVHRHEQTKKKKKKKKKSLKGVFFCSFFASEDIKQGTHLGVLNAIFQEKGVVFINIYSNSSDLFRQFGSFSRLIGKYPVSGSISHNALHN